MEGILNLENWRKFGNDWVGYYIYIYPIASNREELKIEFINKIDDFVVNQYYINCATENGTIGYPI